MTTCTKGEATRRLLVLAAALAPLAAPAWALETRIKASPDAGVPAPATGPAPAGAPASGAPASGAPAPAGPDPRAFGLPTPAGAVSEPRPQGPPITAPTPATRGARVEPPGFRRERPPVEASGERGIGPAVPPAVQTISPRAVPVPPPPGRPGASLPPKPVVLSQDPRPTLDPGTFMATTRAAERYLALAEAGGWPSLPPGAAPRPGERSPAAALLRRRLALEGDLAPAAEPSDLFDEELGAALRRFQTRHGLAETGTVGPRTLAALNVPAAERHRQLALSAQRLLGTSFGFGDRYVVVNVPSAAVEAVEGGAVRRRYTAVVGKRDRQTPQIMAKITNVNVNPTWTVPASVVRKDIIPQMRRDPGTLARMNIRVLDGQGAEVDPGRIDWSTDRAAGYTLRQDAGAANSLGQIRIDMPNRHAVYLHDTPTKGLFARDARFHSSGCVRVADVKAFAEWLLAESLGPNGPWREADLDAAIATGAREDLKLSRPVPVAFVYLTGYATADGTAHFREDVYGLDREAPAPVPVASAPDPVRTGSLGAAPKPVQERGAPAR